MGKANITPVEVSEEKTFWNQVGAVFGGLTWPRNKTAGGLRHPTPVGMKTLAITIGIFKNQVYAYRLRQGGEGQVRLELGLKGSERVWDWRPYQEGSLEEMQMLYQTLQSYDRGRWLKVE